MSKKIAILIVVILAILIGGFTSYWFYQANKLKKSSMNFINSHSQNSVRNVKVSGFPFKNILTIEDLKIVLSGEDDESITPETFKSPDYTIKINTIRFSNSLFTNKVAIENISDISFQKNDGDAFLLRFNQPPIINLVFNRNLVKELEYQDQGYAILDSNNNEILRIDGASSLTCSLIEKDDKFYGKINLSSNSLTTGDINRLSALFDQKIQGLNPTSSEDSVKREFLVDLEYALSLKDKLKSKNDLYEIDQFNLEFLNIKNLEIINPSGKIVLNGNLNKSPIGDDFFYDLTLGFENFDIIIKDLKEFYKEFQNAKQDGLKIPQEQNQDLALDQANVSSENSKPQMDMIDSMVDFALYVASQNPATDGKKAIFNFKKDGKVMLLNNIPSDQLLMQFFMIISQNQGSSLEQKPNISQ